MEYRIGMIPYDTIQFFFFFLLRVNKFIDIRLYYCTLLQTLYNNSFILVKRQAMCIK